MRHRHLLAGARPPVYEDRFAHLFLDLPSLAAAVPTPLVDRAIGRLIGPVRGFEGEVLARSRCVEEALAPRLAAGLRQAVVLGAGFDTMALQHAGSGCRFFEVDHPATQAEKRAMLARQSQLRPDVRFVPVDFERDDLADALLAAGFDAAPPALVSRLGVTMYLPQGVTVATLQTLRRILVPGSAVNFDAFPRREETLPSEQPMFALARALTARQGEPLIGAFDAQAFARAIEGRGWRIADLIMGDAMRCAGAGSPPGRASSGRRAPRCSTRWKRSERSYSARRMPVRGWQFEYSKNCSSACATVTSRYSRSFAAGLSVARYFMAAPKIATCVGCDSAQRSSLAGLFHQLMPQLYSSGLPAASSTVT